MDRRLLWLWLLVPLLVGLAALTPALANGFTNWDDPLYLLRNRLVTDPLADGLGGLLLTEEIGYPVPITVLALAGQHALFGFDPAGFHAVSLALHLFNATAVVLLCRNLLGLRGPRVAAAAVAGALFVAHPLVVEPVAWVVGQKDLLATGLLLAALLVRSSARGDRPASVAAIILLVTLSLAAKPNTVAAPILLLGVDLVAGRSPRRPAALVLYSATTLLALAAALLALRGHGALGAAPSSHLGARSLAEAGWALSLQTGHLVWPDPLTARYFAPASLLLHVLLSLWILAVAGAGAALAWCRGQRALAFAIGGALAAYTPTSGLVPLTRGPADSYMYLPLALLAIAAAAGIARLIDLRSKRVLRLATFAALGVVIAALVLTSRAQARSWRDAPALWQRVAMVYPSEPVALMRLADAYAYSGELDVAIRVYEEVERRFPGFVTSRIAHGDVLEATGRAREAERVFADGARRVRDDRFRDRYGFFLINHPELEPSDEIAARRSMVLIAPLLARRGKRLRTLQRARELLLRYGEREHAAAVQRRIDQRFRQRLR